MSPRRLAAAVAAAATLLFAGAASCDAAPAREPEEIHVPLEWPDCDADDKIGKWDTEDCGPSPAARRSPTAARTTRAPAAPPRPATVPTRRR